MVQLSALVFRDDKTPLDELLEQLSGMRVNLSSDQVSIQRAAHAVEGEVWSPQLLPYDDWNKHKDIETKVLRIEGQDPAYDEGLLAWGRLDFIDDDLREELLAGVRASGNREAFAAAVVKNRVFADDDDLQGAITVRQDSDGYVLVGIDIRRYAQAIGATDNLVVVLPAAVDGVPIVRIAQEAFVRRLVQGVDVRLLVIPDTARRLGNDAFTALSCRHVHLGAHLVSGGEQACDFASVYPFLTTRSYSVSEQNPAYSAHEGSLYSKDGKSLLLLAGPYASRVEIPEGVVRIGATAFCEGATQPSFVLAPTSLEKVGSRVWDDAVWVCPEGSVLPETLTRRGVRLASKAVVERDGCWYDFDEEGAVLVAGPPAPQSRSVQFAASIRLAKPRRSDTGGTTDDEQAAPAEQVAPAEQAAPAEQVAPAEQAKANTTNKPSKVLALPHSVCGRPLVRIATRALPYAPETLIIPPSVREIERENACLGTKKLTLSDGIVHIGEHSFRSRILDAPVLIPASVRSIGSGCFEYAVCRLAHNGALVHVPADQLLSCFIEGKAEGDGGNRALPFDFARYDEVLLGGKNIPDRLGALLHRLACPYELSESTKAALVAQARSAGRDALAYVAREGSIDEVAALVDAGFIDEENFDRQIELLRSCNRTDCVMFLMERHRAQATEKPAQSLKARFAL